MGSGKVVSTRQDWSKLKVGKRVQVNMVSGQTYFGVIDDADQHRTVIWVAADGHQGRKLFHCEDSNEVFAAR